MSCGCNLEAEWVSGPSVVPGRVQYKRVIYLGRKQTNCGGRTRFRGTSLKGTPQWCSSLYLSCLRRTIRYEKKTNSSLLSVTSDSDPAPPAPPRRAAPNPLLSRESFLKYPESKPEILKTRNKSSVVTVTALDFVEQEWYFLCEGPGPNTYLRCTNTPWVI